MSKFNPNEHIIKLQGKEYLEIKWRIVWFREDHPMGSIQTELVHYEDGLAIVKATVIVEGVIIATGIANADSRNSKPMWKGKEIMKAETAAQGRALAVAGYGTQFTGEDEGDFLADSPVERNSPPAPKKVIPLAQPIPNRVETSSNGKAATQKPQWKPAELNKFNDNIGTRFPGSLALQAGIKSELEITRWDELGSQTDAVNVLYTHLYDLCAPVLVDRTPWEGSLKELGPLTVEQVRRTGKEKIYNGLIEQYHYLGYTRAVGEHLKYVIEAGGRPVALLGWSSAPRHLGCRDRYIGWSQEARRRNIRYVAYNTRFLVLPWCRAAHLASHLLGRMAQEVARDWQRVYDHPVYFLETFVDPGRFRGTSYRAANWVYLGRTVGRGKDSESKRPNRSIKEVLGYPLDRRFRELLGAG